MLDRILKKFNNTQNQKSKHSRIKNGGDHCLLSRKTADAGIEADVFLKDKEQHQPGDGDDKFNKHIGAQSQADQHHGWALQHLHGQFHLRGLHIHGKDQRKDRLKKHGQKDAAAEIDPHMEENRIADFPGFAVDIGKKAAQGKSIEKLLEISVHQAEEKTGEEDGEFFAVADGAVDKKFTE